MPMIPAKKYSSRMELYRRLLRGRDYMDSFSGVPVHLGGSCREGVSFPVSFSSVVSGGLSRDAEPIPAAKTADKRPAAPGTRRAERDGCLSGGWLRECYLLQRAFPAQLWVFATRIPSAEKRLAITWHRYSCLCSSDLQVNPSINDRQIDSVLARAFSVPDALGQTWFCRKYVGTGKAMLHASLKYWKK